MKPLKNNGTPDKRFLRKSNEMIVKESPILPFKNGYMQFHYKPITLTNGIVSNYKSEE